MHKNVHKKLAKKIINEYSKLTPSPSRSRLHWPLSSPLLQLLTNRMESLPHKHSHVLQWQWCPLSRLRYLGQTRPGHHCSYRAVRSCNYGIFPCLSCSCCQVSFPYPIYALAGSYRTLDSLCHRQIQTFGLCDQPPTSWCKADVFLHGSHANFLLNFPNWD